MGVPEALVEFTVNVNGAPPPEVAGGPLSMMVVTVTTEGSSDVWLGVGFEEGEPDPPP
jgi:hypothetical protein